VRPGRPLSSAKRIFDAVGITVVLDESLLILEALSDAGVKVGLSRRTAQLLAAQTLLGSAKLLKLSERP